MLSAKPKTEPIRIRKSFLSSSSSSPPKKDGSLEQQTAHRQAILGRRKTSTKMHTRRRTFDSIGSSSVSSAASVTSTNFAPEVNSIKERSSSMERRDSDEPEGRQSFSPESFANLSLNSESKSRSSEGGAILQSVSDGHLMDSSGNMKKKKEKRPSFVNDVLRKISGVSSKLFSTHVNESDDGNADGSNLTLPSTPTAPLTISTSWQATTENEAQNRQQSPISPAGKYLDKLVNKDQPMEKIPPINSNNTDNKVRLYNTPERKKSVTAAQRDSKKKFKIEFNTHSRTGAYHANEDRFLAYTDVTTRNKMIIGEHESETPYTSLFGVFDGHGGAACSEWCAQNMGSIFNSSVYNTDIEDTATSLKMALAETTLTAENDFCRWGLQTGDDSGACSLLVGLRGHFIGVAAAGDCQAVMCYENGRKIKKLNKPHRSGDSDEKQRIYKAGGYVKRGRVMSVLEPSRTIGDLDVKKMCEKAVIAEPFVDAFDYEVYLGRMQEIPTYIILASDGVFDVMDGKNAARIVNKVLMKEPRSPQCARILCNEAKRMGSDDDITAIICFLE